MAPQVSARPTLANNIIERIDVILTDAEKQGKPLELDPYRPQLFEAFVMADAAGYLGEDSPCDMSSDGLCRALAERWGLTEAARESFANQKKLDADQLARMRLLWSLMRMWMEWSYAWERWGEFHSHEKNE
jgi:hypothetical protein